MTTAEEADQRRRLERARAIALFRYSLIQEVISPHLTPAQRGRRVRELAAMTHDGPDGRPARVSYQSIGRWKRAYLSGGFDALVPAPRQASPRTPAEVLDLAAALKRENRQETPGHLRRRDLPHEAVGGGASSTLPLSPRRAVSTPGTQPKRFLASRG